jgi:hypothetical protein
MLLGAFRGGNPLERIVGISDKWSGKLPRYDVVGSLMTRFRSCEQDTNAWPSFGLIFPILKLNS